MHRLTFKAKALHASKNNGDKYFMVGLSDDKLNVKDYVIFQKPFNLGKYDDPLAEANGIYVECNGDHCYNCTKDVVLTVNELSFIVQEETEIIIDISEIKISTKFINYMSEIFGDFFKNQVKL